MSGLSLFEHLESIAVSLRRRAKKATSIEDLIRILDELDAASRDMLSRRDYSEIVPDLPSFGVEVRDYRDITAKHIENIEEVVSSMYQSLEWKALHYKSMAKKMEKIEKTVSADSIFFWNKKKAPVTVGDILKGDLVSDGFFNQGEVEALVTDFGGDGVDMNSTAEDIKKLADEMESQINNLGRGYRETIEIVSKYLHGDKKSRLLGAYKEAFDEIVAVAAMAGAVIATAKGGLYLYKRLKYNLKIADKIDRYFDALINSIDSSETDEIMNIKGKLVNSLTNFYKYIEHVEKRGRLAIDELREATENFLEKVLKVNSNYDKKKVSSLIKAYEGFAEEVDKIESIKD